MPDHSDPRRADIGGYLVVVLDPVTNAVESYGPMPGDAALRMAEQLQALLIEHGPSDVLITLARFHDDRLGLDHPDDP